MTYSIKIIDSMGKPVGELMTASSTDILSLLNKGMMVIDQNTGQSITEEQVCSVIGVSESVVTA